MADINKMPNPHQEEIDKLAIRVLPIVRAMPFAMNRKEPWLGNAAVDKAVIATLEVCFALADQDRNIIQPVAEALLEETTVEHIPEMVRVSDEPPSVEVVTQVINHQNS
jgi:hypothetical protein